jgi:hypothetical protein
MSWPGWVGDEMAHAGGPGYRDLHGEAPETDDYFGPEDAVADRYPTRQPAGPCEFCGGQADGTSDPPAVKVRAVDWAEWEEFWGRERWPVAHPECLEVARL